MAFFYVCKQHSVTWNISQLKCQQLNTQNSQSILLHAYGQFLVLCECWEHSERLKGVKRIRSGVGVALQNIPSAALYFTEGKLRPREGRRFTQDLTARERQALDGNSGLLLPLWAHLRCSPESHETWQCLECVRKTTALKGGNKGVPSTQPSGLWDQVPTKQ